DPRTYNCFRDFLRDVNAFYWRVLHFWPSSCVFCDFLSQMFSKKFPSKYTPNALDMRYMSSSLSPIFPVSTFVYHVLLFPAIFATCSWVRFNSFLLCLIRTRISPLLFVRERNKFYLKYM